MFFSLFEIGSFIYTTSPSLVVLIIGRAVAGTGASNLFPGALIIIVDITPLKKRPSKFPLAEQFLRRIANISLVYIGILTSTFGPSSVIGPVIGGALT